MTDLVEFLRARNGEVREWPEFLRALASALPTDPRALLRIADWIEAEVEARWQIIDEHEAGHDPCDAHDANFETIPCDTLRLLALPCADHSAYREEWKP